MRGCRCAAPASLRLHRTNRLYPAMCRRCGARLGVAELVALLLDEQRRLEGRIERLERAASDRLPLS